MARAEGDAASAFEAELSRLAGAAADAFEARGTPTDPEGLELRARAPDGFDVGVRRTADAVEVRVAAWTHRSSLHVARGADEADEALDAALDLVAAAMWGLVRVREIRPGARADGTGGRVWRWTVLFDAAAGPRELATGGGGISGWRPGARTIDRRNRGRPPAGEVAGLGGAMPTRPWIGVRGTEETCGPATLPLSGELDLHPFSPKDVKPLVLEYIDACRAKGVLQLRIVHGKGKGQVRRTVHAILSRHAAVASYRLGGHGEGSWGATMVTLHP